MRAFEGKAALITGAGGGIGRALAAALAEGGASLALCGRSEVKLKESGKIAENLGAQVQLIPGDLTDPACPAESVRRAVERFGRLDVLVNNAGEVLNSPVESVTLEAYERVMAVNVRAPFLFCQAALPHLRAARGAILNIGSVVSHKGYPMQSVYGASKHALLGLTKALANEVFKDGVRVHMLSPGGVLTDMATQARPDLKPEALILPEEIAELAVFLLTRRTAVIDEIQTHRPGKEPFA
jgi:NAD(P)-dependent dehydrogenase (short-subunit alcohol dehydrogenase family)